MKPSEQSFPVARVPEKVMEESQAWYSRGDAKLLYEFLPEDNSLQSHSLRDAIAIFDQVSTDENEITVVDLGCGMGASYDAFRRKNKNTRWLGLDIADSPEANAQARRPLCFCTYDGVQIPLAENSVDIVYSRQVFEHVRHPEALLSETHRVLKPGGFFVGSTSHLEPFHSRSFWNYTPYGFCTLLQDAGFQSIGVRPGIDSLTLITRRLFGFVGLSDLFGPFFTLESPTNLFLEVGLRLLRQPVKRRNFFKLLFSGHFCFLARK
ncbi:MAG TPA: class I SAM-dependent methyltransferase [Candidatus Acidoferrum sp.]|nr:class I SAM-dependent methyltransferase [Candidatus Acidoferrum sp.]